MDSAHGTRLPPKQEPRDATGDPRWEQRQEVRHELDNANRPRICRGAEVYGADGDKVGTVSAVYPGYIVVEKGLFFPTDYYIPMSAIAFVDTDRVSLHRYSKDAALGRGWDTRPWIWRRRRSARPRRAPTRSLIPTASTAARVASDEEIRIPVMEEELTATVRPQEAGAVRIEKGWWPRTACWRSR